jgi:hypothetical protein
MSALSVVLISRNQEWNIARLIGLRVVRMLEATDKSLKNAGGKVKI